jgi:glycosyltransferase involved in cell wall biosynthesis
LANLAQLLRNDADFVALCSHPELIKRLRAQSLHVETLPQLTGPLRSLRFLLAALILPYIVWKHRIDTVHINGHWESMLLAPARLFGCRTITTRHQTWAIPKGHSRFAPKLVLASLVYNVNAQFANCVICVSEAVAAEVRPILSPHKILVIPNWISCLPHPVRRKNHEGTTRLLFVGRLVTFKGLQVLLDAIRGLPDISLTVVGDGPLLCHFQEEAKEMDIRFAGFHQNVQPFYEAADVFVMPSIGMEGLPLVSIEAMGNGLPCLFSDLPVHCEITDAGRTARLFRTGDAADLKRQLCWLIANKTQREQLACAAHERVQLHYTAEAAHGRYLVAFDLAGSAGNMVSSGIQPGRVAR